MEGLSLDVQRGNCGLCVAFFVVSPTGHGGQFPKQEGFACCVVAKQRRAKKNKKKRRAKKSEEEQEEQEQEEQEEQEQTQTGIMPS